MHDKDQRKRQKTRLKISNWHFAAKQTQKTRKKGRTSLKAANEIGVAYAKNPTAETASRLIEEFHPFIMKYYMFLAGKHDGKNLNKDSKQFLALFTSNEEPRTFDKILASLPNMAIQANLSGDDIYNELITIFLSLAKTYNPTIGTFTGFIHHRFKYMVKIRLFKMQNDPMNYQPLYEEILEDKAILGHELEEDYHDSSELFLEPDILEQIDLPTLNLSFVSNPEPPYDKLLTKHERAVLVKDFVEDKNLSIIASELGYSNTGAISEIKEQALKKLRRYLSSDKE